MRRTLLAALALATLAGYGPALGRAGEETVLVMVTMRDQPAVRLASAESPVVTEGLSAAEADDAGSSRTARLMRRLTRSLPDAQAPVLSHVRRLGGELVYAGRAFNAVAVRVPVSSLAELRAREDVATVEIDEPRPALLDAVAGSMLVAPFWSAGYLGGSVDVAIIDTGLYEQHEAYVQRAGSITSAVFHNAARLRGEYYDFPDDPDDYGGHGTFVSGLVFSQGSAANAQRMGVAHGIDKLYNLKAGYAVYPSGGSSLLTDVMEAIDWGLAQPDPPEVFNYSYGARLSTDDDAYSRFWDGVVDGFGKVATISAGNSGPGASTVASPGMAYNVISVANVATRSTVSRADDVIATSSSRGPTPGGRKKPDLAAPGSSIWLPSHYGRSTWLQVTGTSFSSPAIAAASALLIDAGVTDPRAVKAVLLNSADDLGTPGWDAAYGWGYFNGERAWAERADVVLASYAASGATSRRFFERTTSDRTKATLVWNRHVSYEPGGAVPASGVLNDLDLSLYETRGGALRAASASPRDNVEQVVSYESEASVLVVRTSGAFSGTSEPAALAHGGGFIERAGPGVAVTLSAPGTAMLASTFPVTVAVRNSGDLRGHAYSVALELPAGFALADGTLAQSVATLAPGEQALLTWSVRAPATPRMAQLLGVSSTTTAYGATWTATASVAMAAATGCTYGVVPPAQAPADGGVVSVAVSTTTGCTWSAAAGDRWFTIGAGVSGTGEGSVLLDVTPNRLAVACTGTVSVAGVSVPVTQAASSGPRRYYLAEGATGPLFDLDVAIANPNDEVAPVTVTFMRPDGSTVQQTHQVGALSRLTMHVNDIPGLAAADVSTVVESTDGLDLAVERTMTWDAYAYGGHSGTAVESPQTRWYFSEGSQGFFDMYLLLANPGETTAHVSVTFPLESAPPVVHRVDIGPTSRGTVFAGDLVDLRTRSFSIVVESDAPVIAERSMYWSAAGEFWVGGHESAGVEAPALRWTHAEGATGAFFDTYLLLANPNDTETQARVTYLLPDGSTLVKTRQLPASSRTTIDVELEDERLADTAVSITVEADLPVVSERSMDWPGWPWQEAHDSFGQTVTGRRWAVADGCEGGPRGRETYILVANPGASDAAVQVTFLREGRPPIVRTFTVGATSRFNVAVRAVAPELSGECFGALIESTSGSEVVVERATYWNAKGMTWGGGTNAAGTRLR